MNPRNIIQMLLHGLLLVFSSLEMVKCGPGDKYKSHKVVELTAFTNTQRLAINQYVATHKEMGIWSQTQLSCQANVEDKGIKPLRTFCKRLNITIKVIVEDLAEAIREHINKDTDRGEYMVTKNPNSRPYHSEKRFNYEQFNRYESIMKELYRLQCEYPNLMDVVYVGRSYENRPLLLVKISDNVLSPRSEKKKVVWIDGGTHAREWIAVATPMYMLRELLTSFGKNESITKLLTEDMVFLTPVINPDGYEYSFTKDRMWRKSTTLTSKSHGDCIGIDVNRNYDSQFGGPNSSDDPCNDLYRGEYPEEEPVVKVFANIMRFIKKRIKTYWTMHSFGQYLLYPNSYTEKLPKDFLKIINAGLEFINVIRLKHGKPYGLGNAKIFSGRLFSGLALDYVHDALNVTYAYLLELPPKSNSPVGFLLPANQIAPVSKRVLWSFLAALEKVDGKDANI